MTPKPVCMTRMITAGHLNSNNNLFGGQLMKWMDEVSFIAATRYAKQKMVTVSVDNIAFKKPVPAGAFVEINAHVKENNRVKVSIYTEATAEIPGENKKTTAATARFLFVCVDENDHPKRL